MGLKDGLASLEVITTTASGTQASFSTVSGATLVAGAGQIGTAEIGSGAVLGPNISGGVVLTTHLASGAVLGPNISGGVVLSSHIASGAVLSAQISGGQIEASHQGFVGAGSPTGFGLSIQCGSVKASDVEVFAVYGTAFAAAPLSVQLTVGESGAAATQPGCLVSNTAGSFGFLGQSGLFYRWVAIGSGNI